MAELQSFLGLCVLFHQFVPKVSLNAASLNMKLGKGQLQNFDGSTDGKLTNFGDDLRKISETLHVQSSRFAMVLYDTYLRL